MGSISNDIFCKILRASDKVYATNEVITQKLTLTDPNGKLFMSSFTSSPLPLPLQRGEEP